MKTSLTDFNQAGRIAGSIVRKIPSSGINLFQLIYKFLSEYETVSGQKALNLSLGNPDLLPPARVLELKSKHAGDPKFERHTYSEDKNIDGFCEKLVLAFTGVDLTHPSLGHLSWVPITGIKTASALVPLACGLQFLEKRSEFVGVHQSPAYDVVGNWTQNYFGARRVLWKLNSDAQMSMTILDLESQLAEQGVSHVDFIFVIRPGNPVATGAGRAQWVELIEYCIKNKIRLINDGAYTTLASTKDHVSLTEVAQNYPELEWAELFSVSKAMSDPGARLGVWVGSKEFTEDFILIKGNTDSGPVPHLISAYAEVFSDTGKAQMELESIRLTYQERVKFLRAQFIAAGLRAACATEAGFFMLFEVPKVAFGIEIKPLSGQSPAEVFNRLVIQKTGIVGVHFAPNLIRYAACFDVSSLDFRRRFLEGLLQMNPIY